jgi:hypothetical protein
MDLPKSTATKIFVLSRLDMMGGWLIAQRHSLGNDTSWEEGNESAEKKSKDIESRCALAIDAHFALWV